MSGCRKVCGGSKSSYTYTYSYGTGQPTTTYYSYNTCPQQQQQQVQYVQQTAAPAASNSSSTTSSSQSTYNGDFNEGVLKFHNEYRRKHGVPDMTLDANISRYAQEWANTLASQNRFDHRTDRRYGENLWCIMSSDPNVKVHPKDACDSWYSEIKFHNFNNNNPNYMQVGHFTQMIWKKSTKLGVGIARNGGRVVVVCNYDPHGNYMGQFVENVPRPL